MEKYGVDYNYCKSLSGKRGNGGQKFFRCLDVLEKINDSLNFDGCQTWLELSTMLGAIRDRRCIPWKPVICIGILFDCHLINNKKNNNFTFKYNFDLVKDSNPLSLIERKGYKQYKHWKHIVWESKLFEQYNLVHYKKYVCPEIGLYDKRKHKNPRFLHHLMKCKYDELNEKDISYLDACIYVKYHSVFDGYEFRFLDDGSKVLKRKYQDYDPNWYMTYAVSPDNKIFNVSKYIFDKHRWWGIEFYDRCVIDNIIYYTKRIGPPNDWRIVLQTESYAFHNLNMKVPNKSCLILNQLYGDGWEEPKRGNKPGSMTKYWIETNGFGYLNLDGYEFFENKDYFVSGLIK